MVILKYKDVLTLIEDSENHLLLGNGFNYGLGVSTGYVDIFKKMIENEKGLYKEAENMFTEAEFDLEKFIGNLQEDISKENLFLKKYVSNKVKLDFMKATHDIVKAELKNIYLDKNEGLYLLFNKFTNYFTLNYDSFLYNALLKFKKNNMINDETIVFGQSLKFMENDLDIKLNGIYTEIKRARESGHLHLEIGEDDQEVVRDFRRLTKTQFTSVIQVYSKNHNKNWSGKDINRVVKMILEDEKVNAPLKKVDDGSKQISFFDENEYQYVFDIESETQNLFFIHGAFHICKKKNEYVKITQSTDKALYEKLEELLNTDDEEIVCVFQKDNKLKTINENPYLKKCLNKLSSLKGNIVIIGCSLSENDNHIFDELNKSKIENIYISSLTKDFEEIYIKATNLFPYKNVYIFDAETISYEVID